MFVVTRLRVPDSEVAGFEDAVAGVVAALGARPGFLEGRWGQAPDDPALWALVTRWDAVGSYRRALSAATVKIAGAPVWVHAVDEPRVFLDPAEVAPDRGRSAEPAGRELLSGSDQRDTRRPGRDA